MIGRAGSVGLSELQIDACRLDSVSIDISWNVICSPFKARIITSGLIGCEYRDLKLLR